MRELYSKHLLTKDELYGPFAFYLKKNGQWLCEAETTSMKVLDFDGSWRSKINKLRSHRHHYVLKHVYPRRLPLLINIVAHDRGGPRTDDTDGHVGGP